MTAKVIRELEAWRLAAGDDERRERIEVLRAYLNPEPAEAADPDREAMAQAAALLETAPDVAERIVREHFAPAPRVTVRASGDWRKEAVSPSVLCRDGDGLYADPLAAVGEVAVLAGAGKGGKSYLTVALAVEAARAKRGGCKYGAACGLRVRAGPVVLVSFEDSPKRIDMRAEAMGAEPGDVLLVPHPPPLYGCDPQSRRWGESVAEWRATWDAVRAREPVMVVVDTGPRAMGGETNDPGAVIGFLQSLEREARAGGFAVLVTAHDTKAGRDAARSGADLDAGAIAGSGQWHDSPRGVLHLTKTGPGDADRILEAVKCSYGRDGWGARLSVHERDGRYAGLRLCARLDETGIAAAREALKPATKDSGKNGRRRGNRTAGAATDGSELD